VKYLRIFYGLYCCIALSACSEDTPTHLSSLQLQILDSLVTERVPVIRDEMDSLCAAQFDSRLQLLVDSLLIARRMEEARLRERIPLQ
jgi:hypothetical protein